MGGEPAREAGKARSRLIIILLLIFHSVYTDKTAQPATRDLICEVARSRYTG